MGQLFEILKLIKPFWNLLSQSTLVGILYVFVSLPGPYLIKVLIDEVYPGKDLSLLYFILILGAALSCFVGITNAVSNFFDRWVNIKMSLVFRSNLYRDVQRFDFAFFDGRETGEILSRFGDMANAIEGTIGFVKSMIINIVQLLIFPAILFYINWKLALISIAFLPLEGILGLFCRKYYRKFSKQITEGLADLSAVSYESLASIRAVQALGIECLFFNWTFAKSPIPG